MTKKKYSLPKVLISWAILFALAVGMLSQINEKFEMKSVYRTTSWPSTNSYSGFYQMKKDSVDVLFLGSSVTINAFSPQEIYNDYGITSYNLGSEQQSPFLSYYWLKEALRYQHPKAVVMDLLFLPTIHDDQVLNTTEGLTRKCLDPMKWSSVKAEAVKDVAVHDKDQSEMSYYLSNIRFHSRWSSGLDRNDMDRKQYGYGPLKGWNAMLYYGVPEFETFKPSDTKTQGDVNKLQKEYVYKIGDLCRKNHIKLILTYLPRDGMKDGLNNTFNKIADDIGADFYNFCTDKLYIELNAHLPRESVIGHPNYEGSVKISKYIGKLLQDKYDIPSRKNDQYESTRDFYGKVGKDAELQYIDNFDDYLDAINDPDYTVFFAIKDEGTNAIGDTEMEKLQKMGIRTDLRGKYRNSWYAIVDPKKGVKEATSPNQKIDASGYFGEDQKGYSVSSSGYNTGASGSSINIGGTEYSNNSRGINIVVWDNVGQAMIDSVTFDTCDKAQASRTWFTEMRDRGMDPDFNSRW